MSSNTASVEALKMILSRAAKGRVKVWSLHINTAFLFADVVQPTVVQLQNTSSLQNGEPAFLVLDQLFAG